MKHGKIASALLILSLLAPAALALAAGETLPRVLVGGGGGPTTGDGLRLRAAIGQPVAGGASSGVSLCSGFLCGPGATAGAPTLPERVITAVYPGFDSANILAFQLNGDAALSANRLQLTPPANRRFGTAWWKNRVSLLNDRSFSSYFSFQISDSDSGGADGIVFALQTQSSGAGTPGGGLGFSGISPSLGIEFDTWHNPENGETNDNHVGLDLNGRMSSIATADPPGNPPSSLEAGVWHVWVDYDGPADLLELRMSSAGTRPAATVLTKTLDLEAVIAPDVYVGFTAATGGHFARHEILSFYFNNDYMPGGITPDEATYIQAPVQVTLSASPTSIPAGGTSTISATAQDLSAAPMAGQVITFTTNLGTVNPLSAVTDGSGVASTYLSATVPGTATVRGTVIGGAYGEVDVVVIPSYKIYLPLVMAL
jgi:hypothetical protein